MLALKSNRSYDIPKDYESLFFKADLTFQHQRVFDHTKNEVLPLTPLPKDLEIENTDFLGPYVFLIFLILNIKTNNTRISNSNSSRSCRPCT
jgi:exonuclease-1